MFDGIVLDKTALTLGTTHFDFDCRIEAGAITAIAGPSGAGKSTLLNLVAGFEQPQSGRIFMTGTEQTLSRPSERPLSVVFQDHNLFAHLDVFTNVALGISPSMRLSPHDRGRIEDALTRVGLEGFGKRMPGSLSGGEKQRAAFARALVRRKPVLLLDEPFASLDADLRVRMSDLLLKLHRETANTVIMVTHDREEIARVADRVVLVEGGKVASSEAKADYLLRFASPASTRPGTV
ncbi:thiamine ABC transporter ATP-binding protein [Aliirhizobium smilacinae]|uniref:ATP-binding cassette domain-containing protein n=1 Tax=Aliirhizobium smilacinae TaxID=1395944 RepID=A0A5C4XBY3_9HYPH|nr:ATP-binding cassette domain-containing protein [Rhizobium smilacinae]TNM60918.1 ATP-binding cassette domain-containing protein [Rhizobium smilacinae]